MGIELGIKYFYTLHLLRFFLTDKKTNDLEQ
jgi:hypothetical protein